MKIGILSDTHGNRLSSATAAHWRVKSGVSAVFHCGDIGGADVLTELAAVFEPLNIPIYAVYGNVDTYSPDWKFFPTHIGVSLLGRFGEVNVKGKSIALLHSDDRVRFHKTIECGEYDVVLFGHSHVIYDHTVGRTRCINPGSAGRGTPNTCAVLDFDSSELSILNI